MPVYLTTLRGTNEAGGLGEIFSHSLVVQSSDDAARVAEAVWNAWLTPWGGVNGIYIHFSPGIQYVEATAAEILDPSPMKLKAAAHYTFGTIQPGAGTDPPMPAQCAIAVSLTAGVRANGTPLKGRFYLPTPSHDILEATGLINSSIVANIAQQMAVFLNTLTADGFVASVQSRTEDLLLNYVTGLRVGNKVDTMRSRRNALPEAYTTAPITGPQ